jgi:polygalacturonase
VLALLNSVNVIVAGIQLANSHGWTSAYFNCTNVLISGVRIYGDWRQPNSDAIDICSCTNTTIENVDVNTADDCITPKTNIPDSMFPHGFIPLVGLTVRNSRLRSRGFAVKFGTETHGDMSDVVFDRISIYSTHHGIGIDWRGAGRLNNAVFSNINVLRADWVGTGDFESQNWMGAAQPFSITNKGGWLLNPNETIGRVTNVLVENFTAVSENGFFVSGLGGNDSSTVSGIENSSFVNVHVFVQQLPSNNATNGPHAAHDDTTGVRRARAAAPFKQRNQRTSRCARRHDGWENRGSGRRVLCRVRVAG